MSRFGDEIRAARSANRQRQMDRRLTAGTLRGTLRNAGWATRKPLPSAQAASPFTAPQGGGGGGGYPFYRHYAPFSGVAPDGTLDGGWLFGDYFFSGSWANEFVFTEWTRCVFSMNVDYRVTWNEDPPDEAEVWMTIAVALYNDDFSVDGIMTDSVYTDYNKWSEPFYQHNPNSFVGQRSLRSQLVVAQDVPAGTWYFSPYILETFVKASDQPSSLFIGTAQMAVTVYGASEPWPLRDAWEPWV